MSKLMLLSGGEVPERPDRFLRMAEGENLHMHMVPPVRPMEVNAAREWTLGDLLETIRGYPGRMDVVSWVPPEIRGGWDGRFMRIAEADRLPGSYQLLLTTEEWRGAQLWRVVLWLDLALGDGASPNTPITLRCEGSQRTMDRMSIGPTASGDGLRIDPESGPMDGTLWTAGRLRRSMMERRGHAVRALVPERMLPEDMQRGGRIRNRYMWVHGTTNEGDHLALELRDHGGERGAGSSLLADWMMGHPDHQIISLRLGDLGPEVYRFVLSPNNTGDIVIQPLDGEPRTSGITDRSQLVNSWTVESMLQLLAPLSEDPNHSIRARVVSIGENEGDVNHMWVRRVQVSDRVTLELSNQIFVPKSARSLAEILSDITLEHEDQLRISLRIEGHNTDIDRFTMAVDQVGARLWIEATVGR